MKKYLVIFLGIVLVLLQHRLWFGDGNLPQMVSMSRTLDQEKQVTQSLRDRNMQLTAEIQDLKTKLEALEEHARLDLGLVQKGETFFLLAPSK